MDKLDNEEKKLKEHFDAIEMIPFEEKYSQIEDRLAVHEKEKKIRSKRTLSWVAIAASFVCVMICGLTLMFTVNPATPSGPYYLDEDIKIDNCQLDDLLSIKNIYLPDFSLLNIDAINVGKHIETNENVYFMVVGFYDDGISFRELSMTIVLKKEYSGSRIKDFADLPESLKIGDKTILYKTLNYEEPFYNYYLSYQRNDIRYYFNYKTIEEGDISEFFGLFLT